jgi:hypothetical protein
MWATRAKRLAGDDAIRQPTVRFFGCLERRKYINGKYLRWLSPTYPRTDMVYD